MNPKSNPQKFRSALGAGLLLSSLAVASATTLTTFQVDMTGAPFDPSTMTVSARGSFGGPSSAWGVLPLTNNPAGANPNLWTGTTNLPFNGGVLSYKYTIEPGTTYETISSGGAHNRLATVPSTSGATLVLPEVFFNDDGSNAVAVTFQVNMAQQINNGTFTSGSSVFTRGVFNGYAADFAMTNDPSIRTTNQFGLVSTDVYVYTYGITNSPGATLDFKFYIDTGANWESPAPLSGDPADNNNRFFNLSSASAQSLPILYFNDAPYSPIVTNDVTFQVDMTGEVVKGAFDPSTGSVELRGNFNSWGPPSGTQILLTNDLTASNTNLFKTAVHFVDGINASFQYKFWAIGPANGGWENGNNRTFNLANTNSQILPEVFFDNLDPNDVLPADTIVTFGVNMNGAVGTDAHVFNPASGDAVYINGIPGGFATWDGFLPLLTNNPVGSQIYSIDLLIPKGSSVQQTYKYGINATDDEAPQNSNHVRYIRSTGTYVMPLDTFGSIVVESSFGNFTVSPSASNHVLLSWLGRPGVHLQSSSNLSSGTWVDHMETDGLSSTNWPVANGNLFFRLVKP
jgi:hypothetical protein